MNNIKMAKGLEIRSDTERVTIENNIVSGSTEKCEQLLNIPDKEETTINGITYKIENGTITLNGTSTASFNLVINTTKVSISGTNGLKIFVSGTHRGLAYQPQYTLVNSNGQGLGMSSTQANMFVTTTNDYELIMLKIWVATTDTFENYEIKPMLVKGSIAPTTFQPFFTGLLYGYYKGLQLDKFSYIDKTNRIKHNGGKIIALNGTEAWSIAAFGTIFDNSVLFLMYEKTINAPNYTEGMCDTLQWYNSGYLQQNNDTGIYYSVNQIRIRIKGITTLEQLKQWLTDNNTTINLQLSTTSESGIEEF